MESQGVIAMTAREVRRLYVIQQVLERKLRQGKAAELLQCSVRQIKRCAKRVRQEGAQGIVHRLRGQRSNRQLATRVKQRVLQLYQTQYRDFGPTLLAEKLFERHRIRVNRETARQWLLAAGLWSRKRKAQTHRQWRERKACCGEMVQLDGSHHDWLEGRGPALVLMGYIDDATSRVFARFYDYEGTLPAMDSFARYSRRYGLPQSVYADLHTTYRSPGKRTVDDELAGRARPQSQFERALAELGVQMIPAYSPQAKGRVERLFRTFQDRVIKEMRLAGITTRDAANRFLEGYLPTYNRRFCRLARNPTDLHRPLPTRQVWQRILAIRARHVLRNDNTVQHETRTYLLAARWNGSRPQTIQAEVRLNGRLVLLDGDRVLRYHEVLVRPPAVRAARPSPAGRQRRRMPAPDHPWRRWTFSHNHAQGTVLLCKEGDTSKLR